MAKGTSLHVGVNRLDPAHYAGWPGTLNACETDARSTEAIARSMGFRTSVLLTEAATRAAVVSFLENAAAELGCGDMLALSYSGHGGQLPDLNGDESDCLDETWCLYDGQLADDELYALYARFGEGVRILILSDSCHSGTVAKAPQSSGSLLHSEPTIGSAAAKFMPDDVAKATYEQNAAFYDRLRRTKGDSPNTDDARIRASVRLISGCQDQEVSFDGTFNSAFTAALLQVWAGGAFEGDYDEFHRQIQRRLAPRQTPNHFRMGPIDPAYDRQRPFAIG